MRYIQILSLTLLFTSTASPCQSQKVEENIILINIEYFDKGRIAKLVSEINELNPKVISIDVAFPEYFGDDDDKHLYRSFRDTKKLILPSEISSEGQDYYGNEVTSVYLTFAMEFFIPNVQTGFVSMSIDKDQQISNQFVVWQKSSYSDDIYHHFSVATAMAFDSLKTINFIKNHERLVNVNFNHGKRKFKIFSATEILKDKITNEDIEGKIVMIGFLGPGNHDKFYSPFNSNSHEPDIYGLEYLAIILAQVLEE